MKKDNVRAVFITIIVVVLVLRIISIGVIWGILKAHIQSCYRPVSEIFQNKKSYGPFSDGDNFGYVPGDFIIKFDKGRVVSVTKKLGVEYSDAFKKRVFKNSENLKNLSTNLKKRLKTIKLKPCQDWYWKQNKSYNKYRKRMIKAILISNKVRDLESLYFLPINEENNTFLVLGGNHSVDGINNPLSLNKSLGASSNQLDIRQGKIERFRGDKDKTDPAWSEFWNEKNTASASIPGIEDSFKDKVRSIGVNQKLVFSENRNRASINHQKNFACAIEDFNYSKTIANRVDSVRLKTASPANISASGKPDNIVYSDAKDTNLKNNLKLPFDSRKGYFLDKAYPFLAKSEDVNKKQEKNIVENIILTEKELISEEVKSNLDANRVLDNTLSGIDQSIVQARQGVSGYIEEYFKEGVSLSTNEIIKNKNVSVLIKEETKSASYLVSANNENSALVLNKATDNLEKDLAMPSVLVENLPLGVGYLQNPLLTETEGKNSKDEYLAENTLNDINGQSNPLTAEFSDLPVGGIGLLEPNKQAQIVPIENKAFPRVVLPDQNRLRILADNKESEFITDGQQTVSEGEDALNVDEPVLSVSSSEVVINLTKDSSGKTVFASALEITNNSKKIVAWQLYNNQDAMYIVPDGLPKAVPVDGFGFYEPLGGIKSGEVVNVKIYVDGNTPKGLYQGSYVLKEVRSVGNLDVQRISYSLSIGEIENKGDTSLSVSSSDIILTLSKDTEETGADAVAFRISNSGKDSVDWQLKNNQDAMYTSLGGVPQSVGTEGFGFTKTSGGIKSKQKITVKAYVDKNKPEGQYQGSYILQEVLNEKNVDAEVIYYLLKVRSGKSPFIQFIRPKEAVAGDTIRIYGKYFGDEEKLNRVEFLKSGNKVQSPIVRWKKWNIACQVPKLSPGKYKVRVVSDGQNSDPEDFDVLEINK